MKTEKYIRSALLHSYLLLFVLAGCDGEGGGDESCPENTIRSGSECLPVAGEETGGIGQIAGEEAGESAGTSAGETAGSSAGSSAGDSAGTQGGSTPPPLTFPIMLDELFSPSGFMGEGEAGNISADLDCPDRNSDFESVCHHFTYTPAELSWGGVWWQSPENNWGDEPGTTIPPGMTSISFRAWGASGGERIKVGSGYGAGKDDYAVELAEITLSDSPQSYRIDLAGVPYDQIAGGFYWVTDEAESSIEFYIDELMINAEEDATINPCTVTCSTVTSVLADTPDCAVPSYQSCKSTCESEVAGACSVEAGDYRTCLIDEGWRCVDGSLSASDSCAAAFETFESCTGGPVAVELPFFIESNFVMSGYMGGGEVLTEPCEDDRGGREGECLKITWTPDGAEWVGFFFQYPENNWGEQPGLLIEPGATHVRYRTWGGQGGERVNFGSGIPDADGFGVEAGYSELSAEPTESFMLIPEGITELTGAFSWFIENPNDAETIVFYLDDVEWRKDLPPMTGEPISGCTDESAENFNALAEANDGSCLYPFTFSVDMSCAELNFSTVFLTGPFCNWCDAGYPLSDEDGDGIWVGTYSFAEGPLEFKYMVDNFANQERLIGAGDCAPITDGSSYANREITITAGGTADHVYGRCSACDEEPPPPPPAVDFETITFDDPEVSYGFVGFGGADDSGLAADPTDAANQVGRVLKTNVAELWAGTTITTQANHAVGIIPFDAENTRMTLRVYSPHAQIQVRLKAEDSSDPTVSVETEATVTVSDTWETLTFDFASQAAGTAALNPAATYDKISVFFNFGVTGAEAGERTYYLDDLTFIGGTTPPVEPSDFEVTFEVDMTCPEAPDSFTTVYVTGSFCEWCADGYPLIDADGDGIYTGTFSFPEGTILEYKYMVDGWSDQENLLDDVQAGDGACAPANDGSIYANRQIEINANTSISNIYGRCSSCDMSGLGTNGLLEEADGWRLTWSDEFNQAENSPVDPSKWTHDIGGWGWGNNQLEYNTDRVENSYQNGNGYLVIKAMREDYESNQYTSARIKTQGLFSQQYGRFEAKIKMPYGQGLWPAFWMLGSDFETAGWPNCGEIDIMEFRGQNLYESTGALHGPGYSGGNSLYSARPSNASLAAGFHTYAVEWSPTSIKWFVDGDMYMERSVADLPQGSAWVFDHEFFMILNVAVGGSFLGNPDGSTAFPQEMLVDYVRVYEAVASTP